MLLIIKCINNIFFGEVYMKLRKFYNRLFCRLDKTDFTQEEATEIYKRTNALLIDVRTPEEYRENHIMKVLD